MRPLPSYDEMLDSNRTIVHWEVPGDMTMLYDDLI